MALIIAALAIVAIALAGRVWLMNREVAAMAASISRIRAGASRERLTVSTPNRSMAALAAAVNELYDDAFRERDEHARALADMQAGLANLSHDLRTPLTSLIGYLQLMQSGGDDGDAARYLAVASRKAESLRALVEGVYDLSRLEAGVVPLDMARIDAADALAEELASHYDRLRERGGMPDVSIEEPLPVLADGVALRRVLANLLNNALEHGAGDVRIEACVRGDEVVVAISNRAPDLREADLAGLFRRFHTGDASRTAAHAGLGLAIAKELTERMSGTLRATLDDGRLTLRAAWPVRRAA